MQERQVQRNFLLDIEEKAVFKFKKGNSPLLNKNLEIALEAANEARRCITETSTHPDARGSGEEFSSIERKIRALEITRRDCSYSANPFVSPLYLIHLQGSFIQIAKVGNCDEFCLLVMGYLVQEIGNKQLIEKFTIENGNHAIIVIGRDPESKENDYNTWGNSAVVCDAFLGAIYPATQIGKLLFTVKQIREEIPEDNTENLHMYKRVAFDPTKHRLQCTYSYSEQVRLYKEKIIRDYRDPITQYLNQEIVRYALLASRKEQFEACLKGIESETNRDIIKVYLATLKKSLSEHRDKGIIGFFKATWARKPDSYNRFCGTFDNEVELKPRAKR